MHELKCRVCDNKINNEIILIKEMYLGFMEEFPYFVCNNCGTIQIKDFPENLEKYYPKSSYQSFYSSLSKNSISRMITHYVAKQSFFGDGLMFKILMYFEILFRDIYSIRKTKLPFDSKILDVGCGVGFTVMNLNNIGFKNVTGIDPFLDEKEIVNTVKIRKSDIHFIKDSEFYDLIMFHHSFEHMPEPIETLLDAKKHLSPKGIILIRIPIASYAFEKYGSNWFQLDAPRHLYTYSEVGIKKITKKARLKVVGKYYDSYSSQFIVSEKYSNNIPLLKQYKNLYFSLLKSILSLSSYKYRKQSRILNQKEAGDSIVLYLENI